MPEHPHHSSHDHGHDHPAHGRSRVSKSETRLFWTSLLTAAFLIAEIVGGLIAGSLALLADATHMFAHLAGLFLAWLAFRMSRWPAGSPPSYGFHRIQILDA